MAVYNTSLPLYSDASYQYGVSLESNSYVLVFNYNERCKLYFLSLLESDLTPIVQGIALTPSYPIMIDYPIENLSGWFWLEPKSELLSEPYKLYPENIDQYYDFYYTYVTSEE